MAKKEKEITEKKEPGWKSPSVLVSIFALIVSIVGNVWQYQNAKAKTEQEAISANQEIQKAKLNAVAFYNSCTSNLSNELVAYKISYVDRLTNLIKSGKTDSASNDILVDSLYIRIRQNACIAQSYSSLTEFFPNIIMDGKNWKDIREKNKELFSLFCNAVFSCVRSKNNPVDNKSVSECLENYLNYRIKVADYCAATLRRAKEK